MVSNFVKRLNNNLNVENTRKSEFAVAICETWSVMQN